MKTIQRLTLQLSVLLAAPAMAQWGAECSSISTDKDRLACYDQLAGRNAPAAQPQTEAAAALPAQANPSPFPRESYGSTLAERWELDADHKKGTFGFSPHRPTYLLFARHTDRPNRRPYSPSQHTDSDVQYENTEAKFQISFKSKIWENMLGDNGDLWFGYTQQSSWQVYNHGISAPFRETNYEPEMMTTFRTDADLGIVKLRMVNLGFVHQSNGRSDPLSRSWNRIYAQAGLEAGNFTFLIKPWYRIPEKSATDDNADISDYIGRGELLTIWRKNNHTVSLNLRHSLRSGEKSRGSATLEWAFPLSGHLKGYVQLFSGYGESMIDYNHRQNILGVGLSLVD